MNDADPEGTFGAMIMSTFARNHTGLIVAALILILANVASADYVIDFEDYPEGTIAGGVLTVDAGGIEVTFEGEGLRIRQFGSADGNGSFPYTRVLSTADDFFPITVTFATGIASDFVEIENIVNGRFTDEVDLIAGIAYDFDDDALDSRFSADTIHHLDGPGIIRVRYDGADSRGYVIDNFTFAPTPEPTSIALLLLGGLGLTRRRWSPKS